MRGEGAIDVEGVQGGGGVRRVDKKEIAQALQNMIRGKAVAEGRLQEEVWQVPIEEKGWVVDEVGEVYLNSEYMYYVGCM